MREHHPLGHQNRRPRPLALPTYASPETRAVKPLTEMSWPAPQIVRFALNGALGIKYIVTSYNTAAV